MAKKYARGRNEVWTMVHRKEDGSEWKVVLMDDGTALQKFSWKREPYTWEIPGLKTQSSNWKVYVKIKTLDQIRSLQAELNKRGYVEVAK